MRDPLAGKDRTRTDRKLRQEMLRPHGLLMGAAAFWMFGAAWLPPGWQPYAVGVGILILVPLYWLVLRRKADWDNRATRSDEEATERRRRASILGGPTDQ